MRQWHLAQALRSVRSLDSVIDELTEEEVLHTLNIESGSNRRATVLDRLFQKAVDLNRQNYAAKLKEQYKWPVSNP